MDSYLKGSMGKFLSRVLTHATDAEDRNKDKKLIISLSPLSIESDLNEHDSSRDQQNKCILST